MIPIARLFLGLALATYAGAVFAADGSRQAEVAKRGAQVMPFELSATTHIFTKDATGGTQSVVAKDPADSVQVQLVREHLLAIRSQFERGDFSAPAKIHGDDMPGLAELKAARPGELRVAYKEIKGGAELSYRTDSPKLIEALHKWFDAQLSDHGADAMEGHQHMHENMH